jgi:hypothetical protein
MNGGGFLAMAEISQRVLAVMHGAFGRAMRPQQSDPVAGT